MELLQYKTTFDENNADNDEQIDTTSYISPEHLFTEGEWEYEGTFPSIDIGGVTNFLLEVYTDENYNNLLYSLNTSDSQAGWYFEIAKDTEGNKIYTGFPNGGLTSIYIGRSIKYVSTPSIIDTDVLYRGIIYYTRFYKITDGNIGTATESSNIIYT